MFSKQNGAGRINRAGKVALSAFLALQAVLLLVTTSAFAQTPKPLTTPGDLQLYTNGIVWASVRQADGSVIFGGHFSQVNGVARNNIARLNPNGTLDPNWLASGSYFNVRSLAVDSKGNVYVGTSGGLQKFSASGTLDPTWNPNIFGRVYALAIDSKDNVFAGGSFNASDANGLNIGRLVKIPISGTIDPIWLPKAGTTYALAIDADDNLYTGGSFSKIGGQSRNGLAKISTSGDGGADPSWNPSPTRASGAQQILAFALDGKGGLYVGGTFDGMGGQKRSNIAKMATTGSGSVDSTWAPDANGSVQSLAYDHYSSLYIGGSFSSIVGQTHIDLARLSTNGVGDADPTWNPSVDNIANNNVSTIIVAPDKIFIGGIFSTIAGKERHSFATLSIDGAPGLPSDTVTPGGIVNAVATQANGGTIVAGYFSGAGKSIRSNVLRLQADGAIDPGWNPSTDAPYGLDAVGVEAVVVDEKNDAIYLGGSFTQVGGQPRKSIAKLSGSGAVDPAWGPGTDATGGTFGVEALALAPGGEYVYLGGDFLTVGGQPRIGLARISRAGVFDQVWNSGANFTANNLDNGLGPRALAVDLDGSLYAIAESNFRQLSKYSPQAQGAIDPNWKLPQYFNPTQVYALLFNGTEYLYAAIGDQVVKLSTKDGTFAPQWISNSSNSNRRPRLDGGVSLRDPRGYWFSSSFAVPAVYALALDSASDSLYVGGLFSRVNDASHPYLAKVSATDGALDRGWNVVPDDAVYALAIGANRSVFAGGLFTTIGDSKRASIAALPQEDAANPTVSDHLNQFGWTGAWYNPATPGQGILLQSIPSSDPSVPGVLFGGWFTFDSGDTGNRRWYTLQGFVDNTSKAVGIPIYGVANSPAGHLPPSFTIYMGDTILSFSDCNHATFTYELNNFYGDSAQLAGFAYGSIPLTRLGTNYLCTPSGDSGTSSDYSLSGAWYDPGAQNHEGFLFAVDPALKTFFAIWYTLDRDINNTQLLSQRWYVLQAPFIPGTKNLDNVSMYETKGGILDAQSVVTRPSVGSGNLIFTDCGHATLNYTFNSTTRNGQSGTINLSRGVAKPSNCNP